MPVYLNKNTLVLSVLLFVGIVPSLFASNVFNGREVYLRQCMACHGSSGEGNMPGLPNFRDDNTLFKNDAELMGIIRDGRGVMPSFNGLITDEDIQDVTAYLRTFL